MYKTFRFRIYPTKTQQQQIRSTLSACDLVYNAILDWCQLRLDHGYPLPSALDCDAYSRRILKSRVPTLRSVDKYALTNSAFRARRALQEWLKGIRGRPVRKLPVTGSRSYQTNFANNNIRISDPSHIILPRLGTVRAALSQPVTGPIRNAIITTTDDNVFHVCLLADTEFPRVAAHFRGSALLDLSTPQQVRVFDALEAEPETIPSIRKRIAILESRLVRKTKGGKNWKKQQIALDRQWRHLHQIQRDWWHKLSDKLCKEVHVITIMDPDPYWTQFIKMLKYKSEWAGNELIIIDTDAVGTMENEESSPETGDTIAEDTISSDAIDQTAVPETIDETKDLEQDQPE